MASASLSPGREGLRVDGLKTLKSVGLCGSTWVGAISRVV